MATATLAIQQPANSVITSATLALEVKEFIKKRRAAKEKEDDLALTECENRWAQIDDDDMSYYGFNRQKFCYTHMMYRTLYIVHKPTCKTDHRCHMCDKPCMPITLCHKCSGEANRAKWKNKNKNHADGSFGSQPSETTETTDAQ